jgi:hypothetical protein
MLNASRYRPSALCCQAMNLALAYFLQFDHRPLEGNFPTIERNYIVDTHFVRRF